MSPTILITRPGHGGADFADRLRAELGADLSIVLSPVMRIEQCGALPDLTRYRTLIFTSRHGVEAYVAKRGRCDLPAFGVGGATAAARLQLPPLSLSPPPPSAPKRGRGRR